MNSSSQVYLSAGSNLQDRRGHLRRMLDDLRHSGIDILGISSVFETEPVGVEGQPWFLNIAVEAATVLSPRDLLNCCREIERSHGRIHTFPPVPRPLDVDILLYADRIVEEPELIIPHPRMADRRFVLEPLCQIAPDAIHPVLHVEIRDLLAACTDRSRVFRYCDLP